MGHRGEAWGIGGDVKLVVLWRGEGVRRMGNGEQYLAAVEYIPGSGKAVLIRDMYAKNVRKCLPARFRSQENRAELPCVCCSVPVLTTARNSKKTNFQKLAKKT